MIVDVVIPVFNGERTLRRAIDSIFAQESAAEVRVICVDDGSTDSSRAILAALAANDERVSVILQSENGGVAAARNAGVAASTGDFIAFLDQDDVWCAGKLAAQLVELTENPELGYAVGRQIFVLDPGSTRPDWCRPEWLAAPQLGYLPSTLVVRREAFFTVGLFDDTMRAGGDDSDWFARARRLGVPSVLIEDALIERHVHDRNLSADPRTDRELLTLVRRHAAARRAAGHG